MDQLCCFSVYLKPVKFALVYCRGKVTCRWGWCWTNVAILRDNQIVTRAMEQKFLIIPLPCLYHQSQYELTRSGPLWCWHQVFLEAAHPLHCGPVERPWLRWYCAQAVYTALLWSFLWCWDECSDGLCGWELVELCSTFYSIVRDINGYLIKGRHLLCKRSGTWRGLPVFWEFNPDMWREETLSMLFLGRVSRPSHIFLQKAIGDRIKITVLYDT